MKKLYDVVKQKFDNNFRSNAVRTTLEFKNDKIYFMDGMDVNVVCDNKKCILNTIHGKIETYIGDLDFEEKVKIVINCIFILVNIISLATETSLKMLTLGFAESLFSDNKKEILN